MGPSLTKVTEKEEHSSQEVVGTTSHPMEGATETSTPTAKAASKNHTAKIETRIHLADKGAKIQIGEVTGSVTKTGARRTSEEEDEVVASEEMIAESSEASVTPTLVRCLVGLAMVEASLSDHPTL